MVNQAIRPGILSGELADVLPIPYQEVIHWIEQACDNRMSAGTIAVIEGEAYHRQEVPPELNVFKVLLACGEPALDDGHSCVGFAETSFKPNSARGNNAEPELESVQEWSSR